MSAAVAHGAAPSAAARAAGADRSARTRRRGWFVLLAAVLALGATIAVRPPHAPPLYDGIGFPDEPYRWVKPPVGEQPAAAAATPAKATVKVSTAAGATTLPTRGFSSEQGPQVAFAFSEGAFTPPAGATSVDVAATPKAAPDVLPPGGVVVSNLYVFTATAAGKKVPLASGQTYVVNLRANTATPQVVLVCQWDGKAWNQVATRQVGTEIYAAELSSLEPVALVKLDQGVQPTVAAPTPAATASAPDPGVSPGAASGSGASGRTLLLVVGGIVVLLAGGLLVLRRRTGGGSGE